MKFAKVMFLHLSVSHSVHGGGMHGRGVHGRGHVWQGVCMAWGVHTMHPPGNYEIRSVNARAVRILLDAF